MPRRGSVVVRILRRNCISSIWHLCLLNVIFFPGEGYILLITSTCFISTPGELHEIYSTINKGRLKTAFKKQIHVPRISLCLLSFAHWSTFRENSKTALRKHFFPCVWVFPELRSEKEHSSTGKGRCKEVSIWRHLLSLASFTVSSNFTFAFRMKRLRSQSSTLY